MEESAIRHCLVRLREVDAILVRERESALAVHLSLVIERLAERITVAGASSTPG